MDNQPRNIFEVMSLNIIALAQDIAYLCQRTNEIEKRIDAIYQALYPPQEQPNAAGDVPAES